MIAADQADFAYRFDWGLDGLRALAPQADVIVIVDVLRFTSAVSAALESGSVVVPFPSDASPDAAAELAARHSAVVARARGEGGPSLSPTDLLVGPAERIVLPSPHGATLAFMAGELGGARIFAGCLRNATATAVHLRDRLRASRVAVIAAGERWDQRSAHLRPAVEDLLGAGAILAALDPSGAIAAPCCSPEARAARAAFADVRPRLFEALSTSVSGRELIERGWEDDVATSAAVDVTTIVAELVDGAFVPAR